MAAASGAINCIILAAASSACRILTFYCIETAAAPAAAASFARWNDRLTTSSLYSGPQKMRYPLPLKADGTLFPTSHPHLQQSASAAVGLRNNFKPHSTVLKTTKRAILLLFLLGRGKLLEANAAEELEPIVDLELEIFTDKEEGFQLLKPTKWNKVSKAGATVLFEDPVTKSNNIGVIVSPVRIASLREFGTLHDVARKLIEAEQKKPSTNAASLIAVNERLLNDSIPLYEYEYTLDSSRGMKRVFGAVTVASKKLYILNVAYKDTEEISLPPSISEKLQTIVSSFCVLNEQ